ncbi:hypothetical protein K490DRAFT_65897 [Saccharata proteae CBS 121410]|uniref:Uncharacterized protein n=1 Tax=Saccharata proteae CBS 121410 TaxID=1314787 RepID=A0A9P4LWX4_9PEZI|nr:hypothetical protein K490DRAFT_65897 [Saccharata proteae CBS 121410]
MSNTSDDGETLGGCGTGPSALAKLINPEPPAPDLMSMLPLMLEEDAISREPIPDGTRDQQIILKQVKSAIRNTNRLAAAKTEDANLRLERQAYVHRISQLSEVASRASSDLLREAIEKEQAATRRSENLEKEVESLKETRTKLNAELEQLRTMVTNATTLSENLEKARSDFAGESSLQEQTLTLRERLARKDGRIQNLESTVERLRGELAAAHTDLKVSANIIEQRDSALETAKRISYLRRIYVAVADLKEAHREAQEPEERARLALAITELEEGGRDFNRDILPNVDVKEQTRDDLGVYNYGIEWAIRREAMEGGPAEYST